MGVCYFYAVISLEDQESLELLKTSVFYNFALEALLDNSVALANESAIIRQNLQDMIDNGNLTLNDTELNRRVSMMARLALREQLADGVAERYAQLLVQIFSIRGNLFHQKVLNIQILTAKVFLNQNYLKSKFDFL